MGSSYANTVLYKVEQTETVQALFEMGRVAYVSPSCNNFVVVYDQDMASPYEANLERLEQLSPQSRSLLHQHHGSPYQSVSAVLAGVLSEKLSCPALSVVVHDSSQLWYCLCQNGEVLDEYEEGTTTLGKPRVMCEAFELYTPELIQQIETVLRKSYCDINNSHQSTTPRLNTLLECDGYEDAMIRHEALARVLGVSPCWTVGSDYRAIVMGDMEAFYEDVCFEEDGQLVWEEAQLQLRHS
ncbi:hypothetical protein [Leptolyngbya sp. GGD]|uniref:hypothetical protein n=1 Tax=Leptolyngbya sp. GGD TaxID=2997907 RepID=UPI00227B3683|nr:hypothetical protein [Leptolyngbya sp. GGD]MCY6493920.1 hypothetical protein [Leptolyngbya sp. GGD]